MALSKVNPNFVNVSQVGGRRNIIHNGDMRINQRGDKTGETDTFSIDRWRVYSTLAGSLTFDVTKSTDVPSGSGFYYSMRVDVNTAGDISDSGAQWRLWQGIEAQNLRHLMYGSADAKKITLSFWVKASLAGTYGIMLNNTPGGVQNNRYCTTYTIDAADTWEYKTIVVNPNTAETLNTDDAGAGLYWNFWLSAGSGQTDTGVLNGWDRTLSQQAYGHNVELINNTANYFQVTGCQMEVGDTATPFEHRSYGEELYTCQRYYEQWDCVSGENVVFGSAFNGTNPHATVQMQVKKRAAPTVTLPPAGQSTGQISFLVSNGGSPATTGTHTVDRLNERSIRIGSSGYSGLTLGHSSVLYAYGGGQSFTFSAEL